MTPQEFQSAFNSIGQRWRKAYNGDQVELIKRVADKYSFEQFKTVCEKLLGASRYAPMVPDFEKTFAEMRFAPKSRPGIVNAEIVYREEENFYYQLKDNIWADNRYIFIKGDTVKTCSTIIKADHPNHEYVKLDEELRPIRIAEIKRKQNELFAKLFGGMNIPSPGINIQEHFAEAK